jgi:hypothetical protein
MAPSTSRRIRKVFVTVQPAATANFELVELLDRDDPSNCTNITGIFSELAGPGREFNAWALDREEVQVDLRPFLLANQVIPTSSSFILFIDKHGNMVNWELDDPIIVRRACVA